VAEALLGKAAKDPLRDCEPGAKASPRVPKRRR
jgi:hypothetical protein